MSKRRLARALDRANILKTVLALRAAFGAPWIAVLTYHRVADATRMAGQASLFDEGVFDTSPDELDEQLAFLRRYFNPISLDDLRGLRRGRALPKNPALVTFDDGYRDNHDIALPILKRYDVPAIFFVATSYIEERRLFWWDRINHILKSSKRGEIVLDYPGPLTMN